MANDAQNAPRGNRLLILAAVVLASAGVAELCRADGPSGPPRPAANVLGKLPPTTGSSANSPAAKHAAPAPMPYSVPTHIAIPAVNLDADVIVVDLNDDGSIATPSLANAKVAGWYDRGPAPGQPGAAVLDAHVDSSLMSDYRGAFFYLGLAKPGMRIDVTRADHSVALFTIDEVQVASKSDFPTTEVYAPTPYPSLRLITCGGDYDKKAHEYLGNTIVYAHLTGEKAGRKALGE
ncbi:class F sortase [Actinospica sp.]|uniref:class F sortase n=1 Tax=Actinospica sp. TaxID=1872142 RepID=UPI002C738B9C|nr:class F sortase [Actinospica sp.]HWG22994.1 class F sortase [Actinospica sp.]